MLDQAIVVYCVCDEAVKSLGIRDDVQCRMTSAEVMAFAIMSAMLFGCDYKRARLIAMHPQYRTIFAQRIIMNAKERREREVF